MDIDTALHALGHNENHFPLAAVEWLQAHREEAVPRLIAAVERVVQDASPMDGEIETAFLGVHLLADMKATQAFGLVCDLLSLPSERLGDLLGDALTETMPGVLISLFDGDLARLRALIENPEADEYARHGALECMAYLAAMNGIPADEAKNYLAGLFDRFVADAESYAWIGLSDAVALLGLTDLRPRVEEMFANRVDDPMAIEFKDFEWFFAQGQAHRGGVTGFVQEKVRPFTDMVARFATWHGYSQGYRDELARRSVEPFGDLYEPDDAYLEPVEPRVNPLRDVGRNDPCPCGSGKKFKKCCLQ